MKLLLVVLTIFLLSLEVAFAEKIVIVQKDLKFEPIIKVAKPNDIITFKNEDTVTHNLVSFTKEFEFDLGKIEPGMIKSLQFTGDGIVDVECTVHPNMKMTLFIRKQY